MATDGGKSRIAQSRQRPAAVEDRAVPGHWEGDLLSGSKNSYIAPLVERHTRYVMLAKVANKDTQTVIAALIKQAKKLPNELYKSLTWDRGPKADIGPDQLRKTGSCLGGLPKSEHPFNDHKVRTTELQSDTFVKSVLNGSALASVTCWASAASSLVCSVSVANCFCASSVESSMNSEGDFHATILWAKSKAALVLA